jgi:large subunit ribosomal protein L32
VVPVGNGAPPASLSKPFIRVECTMAVPKKKKSKSKTRSRRAGAWKLAAPSRSTCPRCGSAKQPHTVCPTCGWYKNRVAIDVNA